MLLNKFSCVLIVFIFFVYACKSHLSHKDAKVDNTAGSNVFIQTSVNTVSSKSDDDIVFDGTNNLFELVQKNAAYFDGDHDVIIVKGSNNIVRLINVNVLSLPKGSDDTLIIVGNNKRYVLDSRNAIVLNKKKIKVDTVLLGEPDLHKIPQVNEAIREESLIRLEYFDSLVSAKYAYGYFVDKLKTGEPEYYYQLAEMYLYGLGVDESVKKAVEYYEFAAAKDHIRSIQKLGDIFRGTFSMKADKNKTLYFYRRGQQLGDSYCDDQVKILMREE